MTLADVIARVESDGNQYAQRFERLHLGVSGSALLNRIATINRCSNATADVYASLSHGLFQIMGFRLYGDRTKDSRNIGYEKSLGVFMNSPEEQTTVFMDYARRAEILFTPDELLTEPVKLARFAERYNGPANVVEYSQRVLGAIRALLIPPR